MRQRGYVLVEVLVASVLLSIAGTGLYTGLAQGIKADRMIRETNALYDPLRIFWMKLSKDLRNTLPLRDYRFIGKQDEMAFPTLSSRLSHIRYFIKEGSLMRNEEKIPQEFVKDAPAQKTLLNGIERIEFQYAYLDEEERLVFKSIWMEEPYFGIPKAVRIDLKLKSSEKVFSRLIWVPQGRWGHVTIKTVIPAPDRSRG